MFNNLALVGIVIILLGVVFFAVPQERQKYVMLGALVLVAMGGGLWVYQWTPVKTEALNLARGPASASLPSASYSAPITPEVRQPVVSTKAPVRRQATARKADPIADIIKNDGWVKQ